MMSQSAHATRADSATNIHEAFEAWDVPARLNELLSSNNTPSEAESNELRAYLSGSQTAQASVEKQLIDAEETVRLFKLSQALILTRSSDVKKVLHPLRTLPSDVLAEIFLHCAPIQYVDPQPDSLCPRHHPWNLSHVSRKWRDVALSLPRLWATVYLDFAAYGKLSYRDCVYKGMLLFERSKGLDLCLTIRSDVLQEIVDHPLTAVLESSTARWKYLYVCIPAPSLQSFAGRPFPILEELFITHASSLTPGVKVTTFESTAPKLRTVTLIERAIAASLQLPCGQLTELRCGGSVFMEPAFILRLREMRNLKVLELGVVVTSGPIVPNILLPVLEELVVDHADRSHTGLFDHVIPALTVPSIRRLSIAPFIGDWLSLPVYPDFAGITHLHLAFVDSVFPDPPENEFFCRMVGVEELWLTHHELPPEILQQMTVIEGEPFLFPHLRILDIHDTQIGSDESSAIFHTMCESRLRDKDVLAELKVARLEELRVPDYWYWVPEDEGEKEEQRWREICSLTNVVYIP
ncbi:hypothetical protein CPB85DRAFT_1298742 [Mucidula mucida]|nr:hypothetical protein CPB85DRAFT_1298742 [Mucidula mucida]